MPADATLRAPITMTLTDFTCPGLVIPRLRGHDAASIIQELSQVLQREKRVEDLLPFYHAALNREYMASTDIAAGMALPHARLAALKELTFALGRSDEPLVWSAKSYRAVQLIFLIAVPATDSTQYLSLISALSHLAKNARLMEKLRTARDTCQMMEVMKQVELRTSAGTGAAPKGTPC